VLPRDPLGVITRRGMTADERSRLDIAGQAVCLPSPEVVGRVLTTNSATSRRADIVREKPGTLP